jgi:uncharacterized protein (TIGR00299 family) protein
MFDLQSQITMKIAYFDLISGASGDMILGALIDAGLPAHKLTEGLEALKLDDFKLQTRRVNKNGFSATKVDVLVKDDVPERHLPDIEKIITQSDLPSHIQQKAIAIFRRLGTIEAGIHGASLEHVHLHELGGVDTIVDVVGALLGLEMLEIEKVVASPVPLGRGFVKGAHGQIPLPAPATAALLEGIPVVGSELMVETVTPTGAVLLASLATRFGPIPEMKLQSVGYGAGGRDLPIPNVLRLMIGEQETAQGIHTETLVMLETNIDDLNPEIYGHVMEKLFDAGALDVYMIPIQMKKNRPGTQLCVLCREQDSLKAREILFLETTTLGVREVKLQRHSLKREIQKVETPWGTVRVKIAHLPHNNLKFAPEYEDCHQLAKSHKVALREVYNFVIEAAQK